MTMQTKKDFTHLAKVASKLESRPILTAIHYDKESQMIVACDAHRLLRIKSEEEILQDLNIKVTNGQILKQKYPDTNRLIPTQGEKAILESKMIDKLFLDIIKAYKKEIIRLEFNESMMTVRTTDNKVITGLPLQKNNIQGQALFNGSYLLDMFTYLKELPNHETEISYISEIKPLLFSSKDNYDYLITPIREK